MPLDLWFRSDAYGKRAKAFIVDNRDLVGGLLSADLAGRVCDDALYGGKDGAMRMFALGELRVVGESQRRRQLAAGAGSFDELTGARSRTTRAGTR